MAKSGAASCAAWNSARACFHPKLCRIVTPRRKCSCAGPGRRGGERDGAKAGEVHRGGFRANGRERDEHDRKYQNRMLHAQGLCGRRTRQVCRATRGAATRAMRLLRPSDPAGLRPSRCAGVLARNGPCPRPECGRGRGGPTGPRAPSRLAVSSPRLCPTVDFGRVEKVLAEPQVALAQVVPGRERSSESCTPAPAQVRYSALMRT